jgi:transcriptional regulator with XRE-family HTH domain
MPEKQRSQYRQEDLADIAGDRLREAREVSGFSLEVVARKVGISKSQLSNYENQHPGALRPRGSVLQALARQLGVTEPWLRGEDSIPIDLQGWQLPPSLLEDTSKLLGAGRLSLRRWMFVGRCLQAAKRDYQRLEGRAAHGSDWPRVEWHLVTAFFLLPTVGSLALKILTAPPTDACGAAPTRPRKWLQEWNDRAVEFWEAFLEPWFTGDMGLDYRLLAPLCKTEWAPFGYPGSPRDVLPLTGRKRRRPLHSSRAGARSG